MIVTTQTKKLFEFSELSDSAKRQVLENMIDINVNYNWWESELDFVSSDWAEKYGIKFDIKYCYFSIDRAWYLYFDDKRIYITDMYKLAKAMKLNRSELYWVREGRLSFHFDTSLYGGGSGRTHLEIYDDRPEDKAKELSIDVDQWFYELCQELLTALQSDYDYYISDEAIIETIESNEYLFDAEGNQAERSDYPDESMTD